MFSSEKDKFEIINQHMSDDKYLLVHLNPLFEGVEVPENLKASPKLTLKFSYYFAGETKLAKESISAELLFGDMVYNCVVPLAAIWGCTTEDGKNYVWPESINSDTYQGLQQSIDDIKETAAKPKPTLLVNKKETTKEKTANKKAKKHSPNLKIIK